MVDAVHSKRVCPVKVDLNLSAYGNWCGRIKISTKTNACRNFLGLMVTKESYT